MKTDWHALRTLALPLAVAVTAVLVLIYFRFGGIGAGGGRIAGRGLPAPEAATSLMSAMVFAK